MSAQLTALAAQAFTQVLALCGIPITSPKAPGVTRQCVCAQLAKSKTLQDEGLLGELRTTAEMWRADFAALAVGDRDPVMINGQRLKVLIIEDHPISPTIKVHLTFDPA